MLTFFINLQVIQHSTESWSKISENLHYRAKTVRLFRANSAGQFRRYGGRLHTDAGLRTFTDTQWKW